jgi:hypothetical protein
LSGLEVNNPRATTYALPALSTAGAAARVLEVDVATYLKPDTLRLIAIDTSGQAHTILDTCRMRTSIYGDPTDGHSRPPDDSIRDYRVSLPAGTVRFEFDYTGTDSPTYLRVLGLCDFDLSAATTFGGTWRVATHR